MNNKGALLWVAGFVGVFLLYSAFKGESPLHVLNTYQTKNTATSTPSGSSSALPNAVSEGASTGIEPMVYDANGLPVTDIPDVYQNSPGTYVPSTTV